jgi:chemotaxis protein CheC
MEVRYPLVLTRGGIMIKKIEDLSSLQLSALQEAGNIGSGNAAIALSQLIGAKIKVAVTKVEILEFEKVSEALREDAIPIAGIYLRILGDAQGAILLVFKRGGALTLADVLLKQDIGTTKILMDLEQSALKEAGSILSCSYLNALSDMMRLTLIPSVPRMAFDKVDIVLQAVFGRYLKDVDLIVGIETEFIEASTHIKGIFLFMPDASSIDIFLKRLGV